jgi:hypothetical protein
MIAVAAPALADPADGDPIATSTPAMYPPQVALRDPLMLGYRDPLGFIAEPMVNDGKIHGSVQVGAGTSGYREGAVELNGPLGKDGYFAIAVEGSQFGGQTRKVRQQAAPAATTTAAAQ